MIASRLRLPEMDDPGTLGRWLVRHVVALTLGSLLILAILTVGALSLVQVEQTLEAAGTVERISSGKLGVILQVPAAMVKVVAAGQPVRIEAASARSSTSSSSSFSSSGIAPISSGTVLVVGRLEEDGTRAGGTATVEVEVTVESTGELPGELERGGSGSSLQDGEIVNARIVTGRQRASDRLLSVLQWSSDG